MLAGMASRDGSDVLKALSRELDDWRWVGH